MSTILPLSFQNIGLQVQDVRFQLYACLMTILTILFAKWLKKQIDRRRLYSKLPSLPLTIIFGNLLGHLEYYWSSNTHLPINRFFSLFNIAQMKLYHQQNIGLYYFRVSFFRDMVILIKGRCAAQVFLGHSGNFDKVEEYDFVKPWLGQGLLTSTWQSPHWRSHRKFLTPTFHFGILEKFLPTMSSKVNVMCKFIAQQMDKKAEFAYSADIRKMVTNCTVDIMCETAMGIPMTVQEEWWAEQNGEPLANVSLSSKYITAVRLYINSVMLRILSPWYHNEFLFKFTPLGRQMSRTLKDLHAFTNSVILARKTEFESKFNSGENFAEEVLKNISSRKRVAFLDLLLEQHFRNPNEMDLVSIREEVDTFMFAGHDTTSSALQFALVLIGHNPDKQQRIQEELNDIFGDDDREITMEDTKRMTYLDMAIKETLRIYPPVAIVYGRRVSEEIEIDGYKIPTNTKVMVLSIAVHQDPEVFEKPASFIPERFETNSSIYKHPFGYVPFSAGSRNCIGQRFAMLELKVVLATILRRFNLKTITQREEIALDGNLVLKSKTPLEIQFSKR